jgi:hypothetical protein
MATKIYVFFSTYYLSSSNSLAAVRRLLLSFVGKTYSRLHGISLGTPFWVPKPILRLFDIAPLSFQSSRRFLLCFVDHEGIELENRREKSFVVTFLSFFVLKIISKNGTQPASTSSS